MEVTVIGSDQTEGSTIKEVKLARLVMVNETGKTEW